MVTMRVNKASKIKCRRCNGTLAFDPAEREFFCINCGAR